MRVAELQAALLDYWTARAEGVPADELEIRTVQRPDPGTPSEICVREIGHLAVQRIDYSTNWALCGPLRDKYKVELLKAGDGWCVPRWNRSTFAHPSIAQGPTAMIAICRAVVRAAFGDEVEDLP